MYAMSESDAFYEPGSSQQSFRTYNLWESSSYYNTNDLSAKNLVVRETQNPPCIYSKNEKEELRDAKNRRIISKASLYEDPALFPGHYQETNKNSSTPIVENTSRPTTPPDWTSKYWQKAGREGTATIQHPQRNNILTSVKKNDMQMKLNKALSQPLKIDKAASMMAKMGWQGGALGKTGTGIVEPIAPNTVYARRTTGFGQLEPPPEPQPEQPEPQPKQPVLQPKLPAKKKTTRKAKKLERRVLTKSIFRKNVLLNLLDFVKNDYEVELMFESKLTNGERKSVHDIVEEIAYSKDVLALVDEVPDMDIFDEILKYNRFVLRTESEGEKPNRSLCVFKEAPDNMYLVTHLDLRYDPEETDEQTNMDVDSNDVKEQTNDKNIKESNEIVNNTKNEVVNVNKVVENDGAEEILIIDEDEAKSNANNDEILIIDKDGTKSIAKKDEISITDNDKAKSNAENDIVVIDDEKTKIENDDEIEILVNVDENSAHSKVEIDVNNRSGTKTNLDNIEESESDDDLSKRRKKTVLNEGMKYVKTYYASKQGKLKYKMKPVLVEESKIKVVSEKKTSKFCKVTTNTLDKEKNPFLKSILSVQTASNETLTKIDVKNQILEYFDEFAKDELYTEFKFLGPFEGIEVEAIDEFINSLWHSLTDGDYLNEEILDILKEVKCEIAIETTPNGSALIYKTKKEESGT